MKKFLGRALGVILITSGALLLLTSYFVLPKDDDFSEVSSVEASEQDYRPIKVKVPEVSIDVEVKNAKVKKGKWEVFENAAAYGEGSGLPGKPGNIVISAHDRKDLFLHLKDVKVGMEIFLLTEKVEYQYKVVEIKEVIPTDISVIAATEDETLTLYTCTGIGDSKRLVVVAKRAT